MFRTDDSQGPTGSQFTVRVAVLSGIALVAFAVIFFRLWYLEVLSGEAYLREANANRVREIKIPAPRGKILDTNGQTLVDNRGALSLQVRPSQLPSVNEERNRQLKGLAEVTGMGFEKIKREIREQTAVLPASPVTLQRDVDRELVLFLRERQDQFPGTTVEEVFVRNYPDSTMAAHILGYVSEIDEERLEEPIYRDLEAGDRVGIGGLEQQYDSILRGRDGAVRVQVDAMGEPRGRELSGVEPEAGQNLVLSLDQKVQRAGEEALAGRGLPAGFVAMDVQTGAILGMGSFPTFDPSVFTTPADPDEIAAVFSDELEVPGFNRVTQGAYPTGSTFKLITAVAALQEGLLTTTETIVDGGVYTAGTQEFRNAGDAVYGPLQLQRALQLSSDVFFYTLGARADPGEAVQKWATQFGFGSATGIDLPVEEDGTVPTPEWRNDLFDEGLTDRPWSVGDSIQLAIGQGDLQATPLQLATAYATFANGGEVVRPHLAEAVEDEFGRTVSTFEPEPRRQIDIDPAYRTTIMDGLRDAAMAESGTSFGVFGNFPIDIAGKTGTAETALGIDQSWYAAVAPYDNPQVAVVVTVERGGFGSDSAAPVAHDILSAYFGLNPNKLAPPETTTDPLE